MVSSAADYMQLVRQEDWLRSCQRIGVWYLYLADVLQLVIHCFNDRPLSEHQLVIEVHQRVLHVLLNLCDKMYVIHEQLIEEVMTYVSSIGKQFSEQPFREVLVFQRLTVIDIARSEPPLDNLAFVIDDQMQLETIEPSHRALAFCGPSLHGLVHMRTLDMA